MIGKSAEIVDGMKTAIITGAAGGIGIALVNTFLRHGVRVIALDMVDRPSFTDAVDYHQVDLAKFVTDEAYADATIKTIDASLGDVGLNALINNAAVQILGGVHTLARKDWSASLNVNLLAPFLLTQALLHKLETVRGTVINISSIHARLTKKNFVAYSTTKAALSGLTRAMAVDLGSRVRVNAIEPGAVSTEMLRASFVESPKLLDGLNRCHPIERIGYPDEIANVAYALVDERFGFLHGECISLDGGIGARLHDPE